MKILENEKTKAWLVLAGGIIALFGIVFWWMMIGKSILKNEKEFAKILAELYLNYMQK